VEVGGRRRGDDRSVGISFGLLHSRSSLRNQGAADQYIAELSRKITGANSALAAEFRCRRTARLPGWRSLRGELRQN
jgi:hypothetical protein